MQIPRSKNTNKRSLSSLSRFSAFSADNTPWPFFFCYNTATNCPPIHHIASRPARAPRFQTSCLSFILTRFPSGRFDPPSSPPSSSAFSGVFRRLAGPHSLRLSARCALRVLDAWLLCGVCPPLSLPPELISFSGGSAHFALNVTTNSTSSLRELHTPKPGEKPQFLQIFFFT